MQTGSIYIVDDDDDDWQFITDISKELNWPNQLYFFSDAQEVLNHLAKTSESPFIIMCDVNLPGIDGFGLREKMLDTEGRSYRSVPFIFWSTAASPAQVQKAFDLSVHGFFIKPSTYQEMKIEFKAILQYWQMSRVPQKN